MGCGSQERCREGYGCAPLCDKVGGTVGFLLDRPAGHKGASRVRCLWFLPHLGLEGGWCRGARPLSPWLLKRFVGVLDGLCALSKPNSLQAPALRKYSCRSCAACVPSGQWGAECHGCCREAFGAGKKPLLIALGKQAVLGSGRPSLGAALC